MNGHRSCVDYLIIRIMQNCANSTIVALSILKRERHGLVMMLRVADRTLRITTSSKNRQHVHADLLTPKTTVGVDVHANVALDQTGDPWIPAVTPAAMKLNYGISTDLPIDKVLIDNIADAQKLLASWYSYLNPIPITAPHRTEPLAKGRGVGCFFSGGVDSFYSATQLGDEVTHLIFVHGFDVDIEDEELAAKALDGARRAARAFGKTLIEVRTNLRHFTDRSRCDWGLVYHGAALAHVGHLLADHLERIFIPATYDLSESRPWGSHPDLDPLWSGGRVQFIHHGTEATRARKVESLIDNDVAMANLRVCWKHPGGEFNCGRCEKCIRTIISIQAAGGAGRCQTLPSTVMPDNIRKLKIHHGGQIRARENLAAIRASEVTDPELEKSMMRLIRRGNLYDVVHRAKHWAYRKYPSGM